MDPSTVSDPLELLRALNSLFLSFLQRCVRSGRLPFDLPRGVDCALARATAEDLEHVARVPRALFRMRLAAAADVAAVAELETPLERMHRSLRLTILLTVWNTARESDYRARLFYGLDAATLRRLRLAPLEQLPELAETPCLLGCAFAAAEGLWCGLFARHETGLAPELRLLALQPDVHADARPLVTDGLLAM